MKEQIKYLVSFILYKKVYSKSVTTSFFLFQIFHFPGIVFHRLTNHGDAGNPQQTYGTTQYPDWDQPGKMNNWITPCGIINFMTTKNSLWAKLIPDSLSRFFECATDSIIYYLPTGKWLFFGCVCLSASNITKKSCEWIAVKFYGGVRDGKRNTWLNFGKYPDHNSDYPIGNPTIAQH